MSLPSHVRYPVPMYVRILSRSVPFSDDFVFIVQSMPVIGCISKDVHIICLLLRFTHFVHLFCKSIGSSSVKSFTREL